MRPLSSILSLAGLAALAHAHGYITSPKPRMPGPAMAAACGQQVFNNQNSDNFGNVQGILQVANNQPDYDAAACNVWLCKGYQFTDNAENVHSLAPGATVSFDVDIRAPHTGVANVSVVDARANAAIGELLRSWSVYASNSVPITPDQRRFDVVLPDLGGRCAQPGDCVLQWFWDARDIDQTYEACVDFTVQGESQEDGKDDEDSEGEDNGPPPSRCRRAMY